MSETLSMLEVPKPPPYSQSNESSIIISPPTLSVQVGPDPTFPIPPIVLGSTSEIDPYLNSSAYPPCPLSSEARLMFYVHLVLRALDFNVSTGDGMPLGLRRLVDYQNAHLLSVHELSAVLRLADLLSPLRLEGGVLKNDESLGVDEGFRFISAPILGINLIGMDLFGVHRSVFSTQWHLHYRMQWLAKHYYEPQEKLRSQGIQGVFSATTESASAPGNSTNTESLRQLRFAIPGLVLIGLAFIVFLGNFLSLMVAPPGFGEDGLRFVPFIVAFAIFGTGMFTCVGGAIISQFYGKNISNEQVQAVVIIREPV